MYYSWKSAAAGADRLNSYFPGRETPIFRFPPAIPPLKTPTRHANNQAEWMYDKAPSKGRACVSRDHARSNQSQRGFAVSRGENDTQSHGSTSRSGMPSQSQTETAQCPVCGATMDMEMSELSLTKYFSTPVHEQIKFCRRHWKTAAQHK